jgi:hypothetical protein
MIAADETETHSHIASRRPGGGCGGDAGSKHSREIAAFYPVACGGAAGPPGTDVVD